MFSRSNRSPGGHLRDRLDESHQDMLKACEIMKDKLYFFITDHVPRDTERYHFFCIDQTLVYEPFYADFGPLNLAHLYRFCQALRHKLASPDLAHKQIYYYACSRPQQRANGGWLISAFAVVYMGLKPEDAYNLVASLGPYLAFRDASMAMTNTFRLSIKHCLQGLYRAMTLNFFDFNSFDPDEYQYYESVENGDLNILIPGRFLAFSGPSSSRISPDGYPTFTPEDYFAIFRKFGVKAVIRLNKKCYNAASFTKNGFKHFDMFFIDGTTPSPALLERFIASCEKTPGLIAVHCKAGLGRTGTTVGCYMMKHYGFTAEETISWLRICRPGSVIGPQQQYLKHQEARMHRDGKAFRKKRGIQLMYHTERKYDLVVARPAVEQAGPPSPLSLARAPQQHQRENSSLSSSSTLSTTLTVSHSVSISETASSKPSSGDLPTELKEASSPSEYSLDGERVISEAVSSGPPASVPEDGEAPPSSPERGSKSARGHKQGKKKRGARHRQRSAGRARKLAQAVAAMPEVPQPSPVKRRTHKTGRSVGATRKHKRAVTGSRLSRNPYATTPHQGPHPATSLSAAVDASVAEEMSRAGKRKPKKAHQAGGSLRTRKTRSMMPSITHSRTSPSIFSPPSDEPVGAATPVSSGSSGRGRSSSRKKGKRKSKKAHAQPEDTRTAQQIADDLRESDPNLPAQGDRLMGIKASRLGKSQSGSSLEAMMRSVH